MRVLLCLFLACGLAVAAIDTVGVGTAAAAAKNGADATIDISGLGLSEGDVVIVTGGHPYRAGTSLGPSTAGYTEVAIDSTTNYASHGVWRKIMGGTPDASIVCYNTGDAADVCAYAAIGLSGVDTAHILDTLVVDSTGLDVDDEYSASASIVTVTDSAWVIQCVGRICGDLDAGVISGYTNDITAAQNDVNDYAAALCTKLIPTAASEAGGYWADLYTIGDWVNFTVAIRPAAAAATTIAPGFFFR